MQKAGDGLHYLDEHISICYMFAVGLDFYVLASQRQALYTVFYNLSMNVYSYEVMTREIYTYPKIIS